MKNYLHILLLSLLIVLCTVYFINSRKIIIQKADEVLDMYEQMNYELDEMDKQLERATGNVADRPDVTIEAEDDYSDLQNNDASIETSTVNTDLTEGFYITIRDSMIVVTDLDKDTVLEHTGISVEGLDITDIDELREGIYAEDMNYVFSVLESFSS